MYLYVTLSSPAAERIGRVSSLPRLHCSYLMHKICFIVSHDYLVNLCLDILDINNFFRQYSNFAWPTSHIYLLLGELIFDQHKISFYKSCVFQCYMYAVGADTIKELCGVEGVSNYFKEYVHELFKQYFFSSGHLINCLVLLYSRDGLPHSQFFFLNWRT